MSARALLLLPLLLALTLTGCPRGLGERCSATDACPEDLVCTFPQVGGAPAAEGLCDYPPKAEGAPCTTAAECERTLVCSNHFTPDDRYGTCVPRRAAGEACGVARDCASGTCEGASPGALDGTCQP